MSATFVHKGEAVDYLATEAVTAGTVVVQGELVGVVQRDIAANALGSLSVVGVYDLPKATGESSAIGAGAKVYWDDTAKVATEDDASGVNKYIGKTVTAAGDDAATVRVRLDQ